MPGLTREEIEDAIAGLPGKAPDEVYELYQWRNGASEEDLKSVVYPSLGYLPIDEAVQACKGLIDILNEDILSEEESLLLKGKTLFPFLQNNCSFCAVLLSPENQESSLVIDIADELDLSPMYVSLTKMMITLAEYCETGAYYIDETDEDMGGREDEAPGFLSPDEAKMQQIFQKHNPGLNLIR